MDKIDMLRSMGAKVYVCPAHVSADDPRSYYQVAKRLHEETKGSVYINQYFNAFNLQAHYRSTGPDKAASIRRYILRHISRYVKDSLDVGDGKSP